MQMNQDKKVLIGVPLFLFAIVLIIGLSSKTNYTFASSSGNATDTINGVIYCNTHGGPGQCDFFDSNPAVGGSIIVDSSQSPSMVIANTGGFGINGIGSSDHLVCFKSDGISLGFCSSLVSVGGTCTCN